VRCIVCGKESKYKICGKCFSERNSLISLQKFELEICSRCGNVKTRKGWIKLDLKKAIEERVLEEVRVFPDFNIEKIEIAGNTILFSGEIYGENVSVSAPLSYKIHRIACPRCSRESGGYYEAIVQIRAKGRGLREEEIRIINKIAQEVVELTSGEKDFILKIEEKESGLDFYFGSKKIGEKFSRKVANELGGSVLTTRKLHTRIDGRDVYRFTYLVKLSEAEESDVVLKDGKICVVKNARLQKGIEILSGKSMNIEDSKMIAKRDSMAWGIITNLDEHVAEVMDSSGRLFQVPKPYGAEIGREVLIFEFEKKVYAFPKDI
jgi:nonsense-mediated mRNA decay protein 3